MSSSSSSTAATSGKGKGKAVGGKAAAVKVHARRFSQVLAGDNALETLQLVQNTAQA